MVGIWGKGGKGGDRIWLDLMMVGLDTFLVE